MSNITPNLGLFKYDVEQDANTPFSITNALNNNWDKIDDIPNQLNNKVDLDAQNLSIAGKSLISGLGMPSSKFIDLTLGASDSNYTAPANGYYQCFIGGPSGNKWLKLAIAGSYLQEAGFSTSNNIGFTVPIRKGQTLNIKYSGTLNTKGFRFIYAEGEV